MKYIIDQSGKVEKTNKLTVVACSGYITKSIMISAQEKQRLIHFMRLQEKSKRIYIYKVFCALIFLLLKDELRVSEIIIDKEYPGNEGTIKNILLQLFSKFCIVKPNITFILIGKKSQAHQIAIETFRGKRKVDFFVKAEDVLSLFYKNKSRI